MGDVSVEVIGEDNLMSMLTKIQAKINPYMYEGMEKATILVEETSKESYLSGPRPRRLDARSGFLRSRITHKVSKAGLDIEGRVGTNVKYGRIWEEGGTIRAHAIVAKKARCLHFIINGRDVFARSVFQKARRVEPRPFLRPAAREKAKEITNIFLVQIKKATEAAQ